MPGDRLLGTLLRHLQTYTDEQDTPRIFGTASSLLTTLNNSLNVTLLTSQLLSAPAIWACPEGLRTCMRTISVFHAAAQALVKHENAVKDRVPDQEFSKLQHERTLAKDEWIEATIKGADDHSPRWRHLLSMAGLLLGFGPIEDENLSLSMRQKLESALVTAANLALEETLEDDQLGNGAITLVLNHCFPILSDHERAALDFDQLLPCLMRTTFHSGEGLQSGYFLGALDRDILTASDGKLRWVQRTTSFQHIQQMNQSPLVGSLGPLSRLIGHTVENLTQSWLVLSALDDLEDFSKTLLTQWRQNRLSAIDYTEQEAYLADETIKITTPVLWKVLQSTLFASVIILRSALGRLLGDSILASDKNAPKMAEQSLQILRSLYFITTRQGSATFSQYNFVYYTAMDVLGSYPLEVERVLHSMQPTSVGTVASHPLDRTLDLFFLNTAEHFTLTVPPNVTVNLLVPTVTAYLAAGGKGSLFSIFEAAHSVTLAIFSAPQNEEATVANLPFYVDSLFRVFPRNLSTRQFRLAFKTLLKLTSPPSSLAVTQPMMPAVLLDLLHERAAHAETTPIPILPGSPESAVESPVPLSEQAVLTLTVIDGLTQVPLDVLDEWLPITADMIHDVQDHNMREHCKEHFWHILVSSGELDPERSRVCHAWWSTSGGKEWVLRGRDHAALMSGGLDGDIAESKL
ncbi:uncharacterized protein MYCFIDRAFT_59925 [Pseudocercospora fijiensis CIRAD86]|uniref:Peroxisomal membrane protein Pex17 n=1 Tax=Pseudocercospora fijiensis (strain CIRAD86) TaxID=383855 RepID=M3B664_PSEFD|nr:uncharacterized protein MYCFIDRAFT_59925 [Pseudocercospora fijiensis CIRAD86]EME84823.1 hypothetical protein MYCFIDRAFT_59925 [Pseudocercospora fijiensis CIRAD86]